MAFIEKSIIAKPVQDDGAIRYLYPITSADCVYYDDSNTITIKDKLSELNNNISGFDDKINKLIEDMENMTYEALSIKSFTAVPSYIEKGDIIKSINFEFEFNRVPRVIQIKIGSETYDVNNMAQDYTADSLDIKSSTKCTITVYDNKSGYASKDININLRRRYFYGTATKFTNLLSFKNVVSETKNLELEVNAHNGTYIYFCCPIESINDKTTFNVGGFEGGFSLVGLTELKTTYNTSFNVSNDGIIKSLSDSNIINSESISSSNYTTTQTYAIYQSENTGLGDTTFRVY